MHDAPSPIAAGTGSRAAVTARDSSVTKWNVLALLVAFVGGGATLGLDQLWLRNWFHSGFAAPIGQRTTVRLSAGESVVYYESPAAAPVGDASLRVLDADGERMPVSNLDGSMNYRIMLSGWSGRALWRINIPAESTYTVICHNFNFLSDQDIPPDDRVVFLKHPNSFHEVKFVRTVIQVTGATLTMTAVVVLYALHSLSLRRRRRPSAI